MSDEPGAEVPVQPADPAPPLPTAPPPAVADAKPAEPAAKPASGRDQLDRQVIAEISILVDYVSSRGDKSLSAGSAGKLPKDSNSYADALSRFFDIYTAAKSDGALTGSDRSFLIELRDYLASAASPASSSTIAFSSLTSEFEKAEQVGIEHARDAQLSGVVDAIEIAFPLYGDLARQFRRQVNRLGIAAIVITALVGLLSGYVYWGNLILTHLAAVQVEADKIDADRANEEQLLDERPFAKQPAAAGGAQASPDDAEERARVRDCAVYPPHPKGQPAKLVTYTDEAETGLFHAYASIRYDQICAEAADIAADAAATEAQLDHFTLSRRPAPQPATLPHQSKLESDSIKLEASALVAMINGYLTAVMMGWLGAAAFVLRSYLFALAAKTLHPRDARAYRIRLVLGVIAGLAVGFFMSPGAALADRTKSLDGGVSLTAPALAFLAGYAVEVLFGFLDSMARVVFPTQK